MKISLGHDAEIRVEKTVTDDRTRLNASATIKNSIWEKKILVRKSSPPNTHFPPRSSPTVVYIDSKKKQRHKKEEERSVCPGLNQGPNWCCGGRREKSDVGCWNWGGEGGRCQWRPSDPPAWSYAIKYCTFYMHCTQGCSENRKHLLRKYVRTTFLFMAYGRFLYNTWSSYIRGAVKKRALEKNYPFRKRICTADIFFTVVSSDS